MNRFSFSPVVGGHEGVSKVCEGSMIVATYNDRIKIPARAGGNHVAYLRRARATTIAALQIDVKVVKVVEGSPLKDRILSLIGLCSWKFSRCLALPREAVVVVLQFHLQRNELPSRSFNDNNPTNRPSRPPSFAMPCFRRLCHASWHPHTDASCRLVTVAGDLCHLWVLEPLIVRNFPSSSNLPGNTPPARNIKRES